MSLSQEYCPKCSIAYRDIRWKRESLYITERRHQTTCSKCEYCGRYGFLYGIHHNNCPARGNK